MNVTDKGQKMNQTWIHIQSDVNINVTYLHICADTASDLINLVSCMQNRYFCRNSSDRSDVAIKVAHVRCHALYVWGV